MNPKNQILIVDDMKLTRALLSELFCKEYEILEAENGLEALDLIHQYRETTAAILLDIVMPVMDGFQLMKHLQEEGALERIPVILITAETFPYNEIKGLNLGASDLIVKPFDPYIVKKRVQNNIELYKHKNHLEDLLEHQTQKLMETNDFIVDALSTVIEYRSLESGHHIRRIRTFTKVLAEQVMREYPEYQLTPKMIEIISSAAVMHDIGKIAIPDSILLKPGKLTPVEFDIMKTHALKGCDILNAFQCIDDKEYLRYCYHICRHHHERWDGKGYPDGLEGDAIPIAAQIVSIADVYDALTNERVYKSAYTHEKAVNMIKTGQCGLFSPKLLVCFEHISDQFEQIHLTYQDGETITDFPSSEVASDELLAFPRAYSTSLSIDDYNKASHALKKETLERDALINAIPGGVAKVGITKNLPILFASDGFYKLTGYTKEEYHNFPIEGNTITLILPEDIPHVYASIREQVKKGKPIFVEYRIRKKDGTIAWINVHGTSVQVENSLSVVQAVFLDCTYNKSTEQKLLSLMNSIPGGIACLILGEHVSISFANDGYYQMTGYSHEEYSQLFPGDKAMNIIYPEDRLSFLKKMNDIKKRQEHQFSIECRFLKKNGEMIWQLINGVLTPNLESNDNLCYQCVFTDITESKKIQEMLRMNEERYRILIEQAQDIIFEWDLIHDTMYHSPAFLKKFGYSMPISNFFKSVMSTDYIHAEDKPVFQQLYHQLHSGQGFVEKEYRVKTRRGDYLWCRIKATIIFDQQRCPIRAIGTIADVDSYKKKNALLEAMAQKDLLTGLYNKITMETLIEEYLHTEGKDQHHAFYIIDIDNFKYINDNFGHPEGDAVLREISIYLKDNFRIQDIIGRAGGDEFVVFLKQIPSLDIVAEKAEIIRTIFSNFSTPQNNHPRITCSIGIAIYPENGKAFTDLFRNADKALYISKREGKNRYTFYETD